MENYIKEKEVLTSNGRVYIIRILAVSENAVFVSTAASNHGTVYRKATKEIKKEIIELIFEWVKGFDEYREKSLYMSTYMSRY